MEITEINSRKEWNTFLQLPEHIYKDDPHWVNPLYMEQRRQLDRKKNPQFEHCVYKAWLVRHDGQPAGRIIAFIDSAYNGLHQTKTGFVGFFECIQDQQAASLLFDTAMQWLKARGMDTIIGPMNFSIGNECGVLLSGFGYPPAIQMNHNPPYYAGLFEEAGFEKEHDLYAYLMTEEMVGNRSGLLPRLQAIAEKTLKKEGVRFRTINMRQYRSELRHLNSLYNECMRKNWGFVPATEKELLFAGDALKMIVDPGLVFFAEMNNRVVGCSLAVPDFNRVLQRLHGKLFPFGIFRLLWYKRKISCFRLLLLGVSDEFRKKGLDILFYYHTIRKGLERGYKQAELSWISEDNCNLIGIVEKIGAIRYKTYRMYRKKL